MAYLYSNMNEVFQLSNEVTSKLKGEGSYLSVMCVVTECNKCMAAINDCSIYSFAELIVILSCLVKKTSK